MNDRLLQLVENDLAHLDLNRLTRARLLLMSDQWALEARLDGRHTMAPGLVTRLEAERERLREAIGKIGARIQAMENARQERSLATGVVPTRCWG